MLADYGPEPNGYFQLWQQNLGCCSISSRKLVKWNKSMPVSLIIKQWLVFIKLKYATSLMHKFG